MVLVLAPVRESVALVSPCGHGNLGDAAIIDSAIAAVRKRVHGARIVAFTSNPADTASRHGIDAHPILGFSRPYYPVLDRSGAPRQLVTGGGDGGNGASRFAPLAGLRALMAMTAAERAHEKACRAALAGCRVVAVAGGGQLDELWGGPFAQPFALWRWSVMARQVGARFVVLSVGTGKLSSRLSKRLTRSTLSGASYHSFRDEGSRTLAEGQGVSASSPVVPDLAYACPAPRAELSTNPGARARPLVAVSPMAFRDPRVWPDNDPSAYAEHVRTIAAFVGRILAEGLDVRFFATSRADWDAVADVRAALPTTIGKAGAVADMVPLDGVKQLFEFLRMSDLVLACRLHAVLLSHVVSTPVVAVSYERKVATLMRNTGQTPYCVPIETFRIDDAFHTVKFALGERVMLAHAIERRVSAFRAEVEKQYDTVLGEPVAATPRGR